MVFIDNFSIRKRDLNGVPSAIIITFSSGDEVGYVRKVDEIEESKLQPLINIELPKYNFGKFNAEDYDLRTKYAVCTRTLSTMRRKFKCSLEEAGGLRDEAKSEIDRQYQNWEKILRDEYRSQKKQWENLQGELEDTEGRLKMVVKELKESNLEKAPCVIKMLGLQTEFVAKRMETMDLKFDTFISHVQECSGDLSGRLSDALSNSGLTSWYDMNASKLDTQGIIEGVINSKIFTVVLTKAYFERQWCLFEYSIALLAGKPIVAMYEADQRFGGGDLNDFNIPKQFEQIMNHEIIRIDRRRWKYFFSSYEEAIKARQNSVSVFTDAAERVKTKSNILTKYSDIQFLLSTLGSCGWKFGDRLFSSTADGFTQKNFHDKCDDRGATLTVVKRKNGIIFGGFVPVSFESSRSRNREVPDAWLFDLADQRAPKVLGLELGRVKNITWEETSPYMKIVTPSGTEIGFGIHGMKSQEHLIKGVFAGNRKTDLVIINIDEYEVFQVLTTDKHASV